MLVAAIGSRQDGQLAPNIVYIVGLMAMLGCSAIYNVWQSCGRREWLRRLDHAAIFVMIAGTYTPLAVRLPGPWAIGLTAGVWSAATAGVAAKLFQPRRIETLSVILYLALGWIGEPLVAGVLLRWMRLLPHPPAFANLYAHAGAIAAVVLGFCVITYCHVVLGELVPKSLALRRAEPLALAVAPSMLT